ncbi:hypothetical protein [Haloarchaeobius amylolyticus]|uniref:hypothetical protein n=1 Tax=Haloarchaeobius amylolyticus TaxID=1198296 RepID=UPI00226D76DE|nr:hypothetical protein [Haloarchaeobius amylolyticus]
MRRRALLGTLTTSLLAGCNGLDALDRPTREPFDVARRTRTTDLPADRATLDPGDLARAQPVTHKGIGSLRLLVALEPQTDDRLAVTVGFTSAATIASPIRLWVGLTNEGSSSRGLRVGEEPPVSSLRGVDPETGARIALRPVPDGEPTRFVERAGDCWRASPTYEPPTAQQAASEQLGPGDTLGREYALVTPADQDACLPTGQYRFAGDEFGGFTLSVFDPRENRVGQSRFVGEEVPDLPDVSVTDWYHRNQPDAAIYMKPSAERLQLSDGRLSLTFVSYANAAFTIREAGWRLFKLHDGHWHYVAPRRLPEETVRVRPGESHTIRGRLTNGTTAPDVGDLDGAATFAAGGLGPGRYAVEHGRVEVDPRGTSTRLASEAALVELVGDPAPLAPTPGAKRVGREGKELRVAHHDESGDGLVVSRLDEADGPPTGHLLREQVLQVPALRDTLGFLHDETLARVVLTTSAERVGRTARWLDRFGVTGDESGVRFTYDGVGYQLARDT